MGGGQDQVAVGGGVAAWFAQHAQPQVVAELAALAEAAHEPVREGTFADTERHERDRRAKYGKHDDPSYEATPSGVRKKTDPSSPRKAKS